MLCDQCCPNLNAKGVLAGAHKGFDLQVLFQGFEKDLDLPPVFVDVGDGAGSELQMIGQ